MAFSLLYYKLLYIYVIWLRSPNFIRPTHSNFKPQAASHKKKINNILSLPDVPILTTIFLKINDAFFSGMWQIIVRKNVNLWFLYWLHHTQIFMIVKQVVRCMASLAHWPDAAQSCPLQLSQQKGCTVWCTCVWAWASLSIFFNSKYLSTANTFLKKPFYTMQIIINFT